MPKRSNDGRRHQLATMDPAKRAEAERRAEFLRSQARLEDRERFDRQACAAAKAAKATARARRKVALPS